MTELSLLGVSDTPPKDTSLIHVRYIHSMTVPQLRWELLEYHDSLTEVISIEDYAPLVDNLLSKLFPREFISDLVVFNLGDPPKLMMPKPGTVLLFQLA